MDARRDIGHAARPIQSQPLELRAGAFIKTIAITNA